MATYSFRANEQDENTLKFLLEEHSNICSKQGTILRAALDAFKYIDTESRENFIMKIRSRDKRKRVCCKF